MDWARHGWVEWSQRIRSLWGKAGRRGKPRVGPARPGCHPLWERRCAPQEAELQLYQEMRRTFPLLDVAVTRLVQQIGHVQRVEAPAGGARAAVPPEGPVEATSGPRE